MYDENDPKVNYRWWTSDGALDLAKNLFDCFQHLEEQDRSRQRQNLHHLRLYGNLPIAGVNPFNFNRRLSEDRVTLNVIAASCDVAAARIGKQKPAAKILPQDGNYSLRRKSKLLGKFLEAQFRISKVYTQSRKAFLDGCIFGTGVLKVYDTDDQVKVERIFPSEILVDPLESLYAEPRQLMQYKWVPRDVLLETFVHGPRRAGKKVSKATEMHIMEAGDGQDPGLMGGEHKMLRETVGDQVLVVEAWHLRSGSRADDGKHAIVTDKGPLLVEEWDKDYLPFLFFRWKERPRGFWGAGIAEEITGLQVEINRLLQRLQRGHKRLGNPLVFVDARSKLQENAFTNEIGSFVKYMGNPPTVATFATAHPEIYQQLDRLWSRAFDIVGISQDTAAPNQDSISGISAQTQHDIGTERFSNQAQRYEEVHMDLVPMIIDCAKAIAKRKGGKYALPAPKDRNTISMVEWSEVDMKADQYTVQVLPISALPQLPSHKLDKVILMLQAGMVDPQTGRELLDFPDLDRFMSLERAMSDNIDRALENMLDEGLYEAPEPFVDLQLLLKKAQAAYSKAVNDGVPEDNLTLVRRYMTDAHRLMQAAQAEQMKLAAAQAAQQSPAPPAPGAPPATGPDGAPPMAVTPRDGLAG